MVATLQLKVENGSKITSASGWLNESKLTYGSETAGSLSVDSDGDDWTDLEEQEEGTDPNDPDDYPPQVAYPSGFCISYSVGIEHRRLISIMVRQRLWLRGSDCNGFSISAITRSCPNALKLSDLIYDVPDIIFYVRLNFEERERCGAWLS